ncbi:dolichol kinase [Natronobacillus azotifigens]|uniref:DUF3278 domain-containing protein n=1 Tax=Natronobacillus azotifigens TaxID=472978 RepID=A0A9J6RBA1_9BACI|nr:DUF3278 domain-containing protein [Natronobacillus azotifigens]MCZ0702960.1 DUF3278 domain-containing protein [Natronobacillus azotifigens]
MKNKILNRFIGVFDDRDEYQRNQIYEELAFSGILLWFLTTLLMVISFVMDVFQNSLSFATIALIIINMVYAIIITIRLRKKRLDETDCASLEEYEEKKRHLKKASFFAGGLYAFFMLVFMEYALPYLSDRQIGDRLGILTWLFTGLIFGMTMYFTKKSKLQKHF